MDEKAVVIRDSGRERLPLWKYQGTVAEIEGRQYGRIYETMANNHGPEILTAT